MISRISRDRQHKENVDKPNQWINNLSAEPYLSTQSGNVEFSPKKKTKKPVPAPHVLHQAYTVEARLHQISRKQLPSHALAIVNKLQKSGFEAYLVGGCLRDLLLGIAPKDFDIATNAYPEQIKQLFGKQCHLIGKRFRLAHIIWGKEVFEVATFRADHTAYDDENTLSKKAKNGIVLRDNVYGTMQQDAQRRDFTVNSLYYDPQRELIFDFFNGIEDIKMGRLRLIGDPHIRYNEDPVRMLRAVRFMAKLDMFIEPSSKKAIPQLAPLLAQIPAARLFDESLKLLQSGNGLKTYQLLKEYQLFNVLFPVLVPFFTPNGDSYAEKMLVKALMSTDERIYDGLHVNPAFLFAALLWYPLREKIDELKNEGGLNSHDALMLASNEILAKTCRTVALHKRYTAVIRDIWLLQFQLTKRLAKRAEQLLTHIKFRAAFDLLVMRAEIEGGDLIELSAWWHEFQLSNVAQRNEMLKAVKSSFLHEKDVYVKAQKRRTRPRKRTVRHKKVSKES